MGQVKFSIRVEDSAPRRAPPPPLSSPAPLPNPHLSARYEPASIRQVAAYLPQLLIGERILEGPLILLQLRPWRLLPPGRGPACTFGAGGDEARAASPATTAVACSSGTGGEGPRLGHRFLAPGRSRGGGRPKTPCRRAMASSGSAARPGGDWRGACKLQAGHPRLAPAPQLDRVSLSWQVATDRRVEGRGSEWESMRGQARRMGIGWGTEQRMRRRQPPTHRGRHAAQQVSP